MFASCSTENAFSECGTTIKTALNALQSEALTSAFTQLANMRQGPPSTCEKPVSESNTKVPSTTGDYVSFDTSFWEKMNPSGAGRQNHERELKITTAGASGRTLSVGETTEVTLNVADDRWHSGIVVKPGEKYRISAKGSWSDGGLPECGPEGFLTSSLELWRRPIFKAAEPFRPVNTGSRWCSLITGVGNKDFQEIGSKLPVVIEPKRAGSLQFFVNDVRFKNNKGSLQISIQRIAP